MCSNCKKNEVYAKGRCHACSKYYNRTGNERPKKLWFKILGRHEKHRPRWCKNCGSPAVYSNRMCNACRIYLERHGRMRPKHLASDHDQVCRNCTKPLGKITRTGLCDRCRHYRNHNAGKERPQKLWGIGAFGWCACGEPATVKSDEFGGLCVSCAGSGVSAFSRVERGEVWR